MTAEVMVGGCWMSLIRVVVLAPSFWPVIEGGYWRLDEPRKHRQQGRSPVHLILAVTHTKNARAAFGKHTVERCVAQKCVNPDRVKQGYWWKSFQAEERLHLSIIAHLPFSFSNFSEAKAIDSCLLGDLDDNFTPCVPSFQLSKRLAILLHRPHTIHDRLNLPGFQQLCHRLKLLTVRLHNEKLVLHIRSSYILRLHTVRLARNGKYGAATPNSIPRLSERVTADTVDNEIELAVWMRCCPLLNRGLPVVNHVRGTERLCEFNIARSAHADDVAHTCSTRKLQHPAADTTRRRRDENTLVGVLLFTIWVR